MRRIQVVTGCLCLFLLCGGAFGASVGDLVSQVSGFQYSTYHTTVESMGLGLYGGTDYNQGFPNRDGWAGAGTLGNQEARLYLNDQFGAMGLGVTTQGSYLNVIGELPGIVDPDDIYIVCGHYDHIGGDRPGGDDNASGTAGVLEAARVLSQYEFASTLRFIGFNAEEDGLLGSRDYVNNMVVPGVENILGVINLDMILRPGSDDDPNWEIDLNLGTQTGHAASVAWAGEFQSAAAAYVPSLRLDPTVFNVGASSDQDPFVVSDFPAFLAIENTTSQIGNNNYYHTYEDASDRLANNGGSPLGVTYDYGFATDVVRATVATMALHAQLIAIPEPVTVVLLALGLLVLVVRRR